MQLESKTTTFRDYLKIVFRYKFVFIVLWMVVLPVTYYNLELVTPTYRASVVMMVKAQKDTEATYYKGIILGKGMTQDLASIVKSNVVLERVVEALKLYEQPPDYEKKFASPLKAARIERIKKKSKPERNNFSPEVEKQIKFNVAVAWLDGSVTTLPMEESSMFLISADDFDPRRAVLIANSVSRSYVIFDLEQQIAELKLKYGEKHATVVQLKNYIDEFSKTLDGKLLPDVEAIGPASVKIIQQARASSQIRIVDKQRSLVIMFFICSLIGIVIAFGLEFMSQTIRMPNDIDSDLNLSFLGSIVKRKSKRNKTLRTGNSSDKEYDRTLHMVADRICILMKENKLRSLLICGIERPQDSSEIIADIGYDLSGRRDLNVLIIDCNLRNDMLLDALDVPCDGHGLSDMINENIRLSDTVKVLTPRLHVVTSGKKVSNPISVLESQKVSDIISKAENEYDIVLVNGAELGHLGDSIVVSTLVDGVLIVLSEGSTKKIILKNALYPLTQNKANIIGVILSNRKYILPGIIYRFS